MWLLLQGYNNRILQIWKPFSPSLPLLSGELGRIPFLPSAKISLSDDYLSCSPSFFSLPSLIIPFSWLIIPFNKPLALLFNMLPIHFPPLHPSLSSLPSNSSIFQYSVSIFTFSLISPPTNLHQVVAPNYTFAWSLSQADLGMLRFWVINLLKIGILLSKKKCFK